VNPYDVDDVAAAIRTALEMTTQGRRSRMQRLRTQVQDHNIYEWAALLLAELSKIPQGSTLPAPEP
jgi:trehalose 6-phosphate synthase